MSPLGSLTPKTAPEAAQEATKRGFNMNCDADEWFTHMSLFTICMTSFPVLAN
jgi:hypothetical protein